MSERVRSQITGDLLRRAACYAERTAAGQAKVDAELLRKIAGLMDEADKFYALSSGSYRKSVVLTTWLERHLLEIADEERLYWMDEGRKDRHDEWSRFMDGLEIDELC